MLWEIRDEEARYKEIGISFNRNTILQIKLEMHRLSLIYYSQEGK